MSISKIYTAGGDDECLETYNFVKFDEEVSSASPALWGGK